MSNIPSVISRKISHADIALIAFLLDNNGTAHTIRGLAQALGINYRIVHERVGVLEKEGLLTVTRAGNARLCALSGAYSNKVYEAEYARTQALCKNKDFLVLRNRLAALPSCFVAILFGSHAKGTATKHSDIDVLVIGGDQKEIAAEVSLWPQKIHLTSVSVKEFQELARRKDYNVLTETHKKNVILVGIEDYHRLLANARQ